jgi:hypothetical protein
MFFSNLELSAIILLAVFFAGFYIWLFLHSGKQKSLEYPEKEKKRTLKIETVKKVPQISVFESFDYLGTKIYHNDGKYTVVEDNVSRNFNSINELPSKYRKMILEMEAQKFSGRKNNYYMENRNGKYFVVFPDGTKKQYKNYQSIPENLKKILAG